MYNLDFFDALKRCLNGEGYIRGELFEQGLFVDVQDGVLIIRKKSSFNYNTLEPLLITTGLASQKFKLFSVANDLELELK